MAPYSDTERSHEADEGRAWFSVGLVSTLPAGEPPGLAPYGEGGAGVARSPGAIAQRCRWRALRGVSGRSRESESGPRRKMPSADSPVARMEAMPTYGKETAW